MLKFGLEKEFFLLKDGEASVIPTRIFPYDESGVLVEARTSPFDSIEKATFDLMRISYELDQKATANGFTLCDTPILKLSRGTILESRRLFSKGTISYQNLYGHLNHRQAPQEHTAGIHLSITNEMSFSYKDKGNWSTFTYYKNFDWVRLFMCLDKEFRTQIKDAKRNPGFYELKGDGRVEYRSLPANIDLTRLMEVVSNFIKNNQIT